MLLPSLFYLRKNKYDIYFIVSFGLLLISGIIFGYMKLDQSKDATFKSNNFIIKIISPKIGIERFYHTENEQEILENLINLI